MSTPFHSGRRTEGPQVVVTSCIAQTRFELSVSHIEEDRNQAQLAFRLRSGFVLVAFWDSDHTCIPNICSVNSVCGPRMNLVNNFAYSQASDRQDFSLMLELRSGPGSSDLFLSFLGAALLTSYGICVLKLRFGSLQFAFRACLSQSGCVLELRSGKT